MNPEGTFARWHWKAAVAETASRYEFRLIHRYTPADPDRAPYAEGHLLTLEWRDLFYPDGLADGTAEKFITEQWRRDAVVVRAHGVAGLPFWTQHINDALTVRVALAAPEQRFGDDMTGTNVFRVSYQSGCERRYVARYHPDRAELSAVVASELS
jgi:hypothetical protein